MLTGIWLCAIIVSFVSKKNVCIKKCLYTFFSTPDSTRNAGVWLFSKTIRVVKQHLFRPCLITRITFVTYKIREARISTINLNSNLCYIFPLCKQLKQLIAEYFNLSLLHLKRRKKRDKKFGLPRKWNFSLL